MPKSNVAEMFEEEVDQAAEPEEVKMMSGVLAESQEAKRKLATGTSKLDAMIAGARQLTVTSQSEYDHAREVVNQIKTAAKDVKALRLFITRPIDAMKQYFMDMFDKPVKEAEEAVTELDYKRSKWFVEQEKKRIEEQARLDKIARDKEEKERERLEKERQKAIKKGDAEKAEELEQQKKTVFVPAAQAQSAVGKGDVVKMIYTGEVVDFALMPDKYKMVNEKALLADIEDSKGTLVIPGYKYTGTTKVSTLNRGAR